MTDKLRIPVIVMISMASGYIGGLMSQPHTNAVTAAISPPTKKSVTATTSLINNTIVRAKKFELVDDAGKVRGVFGVDEFGVSIELKDSAGITRASIYTHQDTSSLELDDKAGKIRGLFSVETTGPQVNLYDEAAEIRGQLAVGKDGPIMSLSDAEGTVRNIVEVDESGPKSILRSKTGVPRIMLCEGQISGNGIGCYSKSGKSLAVFGVRDNDYPYIELNDKTGAKRGIFNVTDIGSLLSLYDEAGKPRGTFSVTKEGPGLLLLDKAGQSRGTFFVNEDGPGMLLLDEAGKLRGVFHADKDKSDLSLYDKTGKRGSFNADNKLGPSIIMSDGTGTARTIIGVTPSLNGPFISMSNEAGDTIWRAPTR